MNGVFKTVNAGTSWELASDPVESVLFGVLPQTSVMCLAGNGPVIFAGTDGAGVYVNSGQDTKWTPFNEGLRFKTVLALAVKGEYLFAGTMGGGVWRLPLADLERK